MQTSDKFLNSFATMAHWVDVTEGNENGYFCASNSNSYFQEMEEKTSKECIFQFHFDLDDPKSNTTVYISTGATQTAKKYMSV